MSSNDFNMLGFNLGYDQRDYQLLFPDLSKEIGEKDTIQSLFDEYQKMNKMTPKNERVKVTEKLFFLLQNEADLTKLNLSDQEKKGIAKLLFENGLDVLETRLYNKLFKSLIQDNINDLLKILNNQIKDQYGADKFIETYPNLSEFLKSNYNNQLPKKLQSSTMEQVQATVKRCLGGETVLERQFQSIKDRLSTNFFERLVSSPDRPAVIALQEVGLLNTPALKPLNDQYTIIRNNDRSDTAIAIDNTRFEKIESKKVFDKTVAVFAQDKKTKEEFIFISVHIPGYKLEFPEQRKNLKQHLQEVKKKLGIANNAIDKLKNDIEELKKQHPNAKIIIQGDFNSYPEYFKNSKLSFAIKRMNFFSKLKNSKLNLLRSNQPTEINKTAGSMPERELDYVFTSKSLAGRVKLFNPEDRELSLTKTASGGVEFLPIKSPSDHGPQFISISQPEQGTGTDKTKKDK